MGNIPTVENCCCGVHPVVRSRRQLVGNEMMDVYRVECPNCLNIDAWSQSKLRAVEDWNKDMKIWREING